LIQNEIPSAIEEIETEKLNIEVNNLDRNVYEKSLQ